MTHITITFMIIAAIVLLFVWNGIEFGSATNDDNGTPGGASGQLLGIDAVRIQSIVTMRAARHGLENGSGIDCPDAQFFQVADQGREMGQGKCFMKLYPVCTYGIIHFSEKLKWILEIVQ